MNEVGGLMGNYCLKWSLNIPSPSTKALSFFCTPIPCFLISPSCRPELPFLYTCMCNSTYALDP